MIKRCLTCTTLSIETAIFCEDCGGHEFEPVSDELPLPEEEKIKLLVKRFGLVETNNKSDDMARRQGDTA